MIEQLKKYARQIQAFFWPSSRLAILKYYASRPLDGEPNILNGQASFILLSKGFPYMQSVTNFKSNLRMKPAVASAPLVSCLMVTKDRFEFSRKAVQSFLDQTYSNKELIIIDDGEQDSLENLITELDESSIKYHRLPDESKKLGVLRNMSRELAQGEYLAQWDDDDYSHPERLTYQMHLILEYQLAGCTLQRETLSFDSKNLKAWSNRRIWEGSFIGHKNLIPRYKNIRKAEETESVYYVALHHKIGLLDLPQLYKYTFHGNNTFEEEHFQVFWNERTS